MLLPEEVLRSCVVGKLVFRAKRQVYAGVVPSLLAEKPLPRHSDVVVTQRDIYSYMTVDVAIPIREHRRYFLSKQVYLNNVIVVLFSAQLYSPEMQQWRQADLYLGECGIYDNRYHAIHYDDVKRQNRMSSFYNRMQLPVII